MVWMFNRWDSCGAHTILVPILLKVVRTKRKKMKGFLLKQGFGPFSFGKHETVKGKKRESRRRKEERKKEAEEGEKKNGGRGKRRGDLLIFPHLSF